MALHRTLENVAFRIIGLLVPGGGEVVWRYGGTDRGVTESTPTIAGTRESERYPGGVDHVATKSDCGARNLHGSVFWWRCPLRQAARPYHLFVGIDVSAKTCTVATRRATPPAMRAVTIAQTPVGFAQLEQQLLALEPDPTAILVVMEATGTSWMRLALHLVAATIAVAVVNPAQAHDFAKALLRRGKTDAIDACTLAELAARLQPQPWTPPPPVAVEVHQRLTHRDALVDARTQFRNQLIISILEVKHISCSSCTVTSQRGGRYCPHPKTIVMRRLFSTKCW